MFAFSFEYLDVIDTKPVYTSPQPTDLDDQLTADVDVFVTPNWFTSISIQWSINANWGNCKFNIYKAFTSEGPFKKLNDEPIYSNSFIDTDRNTGMRTGFDYYVLEIIKPDSSVIRTLPRTWLNTQNSKVYLMAREINRREFLLLNIRAGVESFILHRKYFGKRCPVCWDEASETLTSDHCPNCFGTGFDGGYWQPIRTMVQYDATPKTLLKTYFGNYEPSEIGAWTIAIPMIAPRDLIVRWPDRKVYSVKDINNTELQAVPVRQIMRLDELNKSSAEYQIIKGITNG